MNTKLIAEAVFLQDLITRKFPTGIVSVVCDSFDFWAVLTEVLPALKPQILGRQASDVAPGKLVIRPDSGDPVEVICGKEITNVDYEFMESDDLDDLASALGYGLVDDMEDGEQFEVLIRDTTGTVFRIMCRAEMEYDYTMHSRYVGYEVANLSAEEKGAIEVLWETFGGTVNEKGFKVLDPHIGLIYGDSITTQRALAIFERLVAKGFSTGNVVFGVGSFTYQCNTRDTFGFAVKATYTEVGETRIPIFKDPKTDSKKKSAKGLLCVLDVDGVPTLYDDVEWMAESSSENMLRPVFTNGTRLRKTKLSEIRERCKA